MFTPDNSGMSARALEIAGRVETFVRDTIVPFEKDERLGPHGASDDLVTEMRDLARQAGVLTPHVLDDGTHLTHRETACIFIRAGISPLGPIACNASAPDEGNMFLLSKVASPEMKERFLQPLLDGTSRSSFFMTEPASENGAGSDPMMMQTTCHLDGNHWVINGRKRFITGVSGAKIGIVMAKSDDGACMFVVDLPDPAIKVEKLIDTIDSTLPGGHGEITIDNLRVPASQMLGQSGEGFKYAQVRLAPARLTHCMRWLGGAMRANEIAIDYTNRRQAFGKSLIDHEGVGFMLAENVIDLRIAEQMVYWTADILDSGAPGTLESSMTKVAVSDGLFRVADRAIQCMGGQGVTEETIVERLFRELRAFRIYDGPTEVHKWSIAKKIKRSWEKDQG